MTPAFIVAVLALILAAGWAVVRSYGKGTSVSAGNSGDRILLDQSPVGILVLDPALRVDWANRAFCDLFGLTCQDLIGRGFAEVMQEELKGVVSEPDSVEAGLLAAYTSVSKAAPFAFYVRARGDRDERLLEHTCQVIGDRPLEGGRVAFFVDVTRGKNIDATPPNQEIHLHELDRILVKLARRNGSGDAGEAAVLREVAGMLAGVCKPDRWELWFLGEDRTRWSLDHLNYTTPRRETKATTKLSLPQTGPYLRALDQVRLMVSPDLENDPEAPTLLGHGGIRPHGASRMDVPIRVAGKVVAVLVVVHHSRRPWTPQERRFAASIGDRMSFLVQAARAGEARNGKVDQRPIALPPAASSAVDGFIHLDERLRFTVLNPAALRWLHERGVDGSTLIGRGLEESMRGVEDRSIVAEVRKAIRGGGPARLRRQLEPGGPWLDVDVVPSGTGVSVTLQNRARAKERKAERSLRESETRFRSVVESLREGLIITDLEDRIVYVNSRIIDLTGHRPEDLDGKRAQKMLFDTTNWAEEDERMMARREKKRTRYSAPLIDKSGIVWPVEIISTPLRDADGTVTGVVDAITAMGSHGELRSEEVGSCGGDP